MRELRWGSNSGLDKPVNQGPNVGITFDRGVSLEKQTVVPWISVALGRFFFIVEVKIAEHRSSGCIGCDNSWTAANNAFVLIEVDSFRDVLGDNRIVHAMFSDAVHLDRQSDRDAVLL